MKYQIEPARVTIWLSARDTAEWAQRPGALWPCSFLSGKRVMATFVAGGLVALEINGGRGSQDVLCDELNAITSDFLRPILPQDHPAWFVAVGQFN